MATDPAPETLTRQQRIVRQAAPSIIGGALGGAAGTLAAPFTMGILNPVTGTMLGSGLGELANQTILSPFTQGQPSLLSLGLAAGAPAAGPFLRGIGKSLPGTTPGRQIFAQRRLGGLQGEALSRTFGATDQEVAMLFRRARGLNQFPVVLNKFQASTERLTTEAGKSKFATAGAKGLVKKAGQVAEETGLGARGVIPFETARLNLSDLGQSVRSLTVKGGTALGRAKELYKNLISDLDDTVQMAPPHLTRAYGLAIEATKRRELGNFIRDAFTKGQSRGGGIFQLDFQGILTNLGKHREELEALVPKKEVGEIIEILSRYEHIGTAAKTTGEGLRGIVAPERIAVGSAIGTAVGFIGGDFQMGTYSGLAGIAGVEALVQTLSSPWGRKIVAALSKRGAGFDQILNASAQYVRSSMNPQSPTLPPGFSPVSPFQAPPSAPNLPPGFRLIPQSELPPGFRPVPRR